MCSAVVFDRIMQEEYSNLDSKSSMRLRAMCCERGLAVSGNKQDLTCRIQEYEGLSEEAANEEFLKK